MNLLIIQRNVYALVLIMLDSLLLNLSLTPPPKKKNTQQQQQKL